MKIHRVKTIYYGIDSQQFGHLYKPKHVKNLPVVVVIHGGYWKDSHSLDSYATAAIVDYLQQFHVAIWNLEYRRMDAVGENIKAPWPASFKDVADGLDHLQAIAAEEDLDLHRILLIGHSAGGLMATWAASRDNIAQDSELYGENPLVIQRVISIAAIVNLFAANEVDQPEQVARLMGGCANTNRARYVACDPSSLSHEGIKLTLIHGVQDTCVSIQQAHYYCDNAKGRVNKIIMDEADHFSMLPHDGHWRLEEWQQIKEIIAENINALDLA
jgi:pimeloyl-ACP methyl ester carboxylesterase